MSLVAYGASDDSETSDVEESETPEATASGDANDRAFAVDGKISDDEDYVPTARIQTPSSASSSAVSSTREAGINSVYTPSTLSDLPAPKARSTAEGGGEREDELEEEVKPKASQLADAPKPPARKTKQPARIVLPALKKDSDDEEEESQKKAKQPTPAAGASGSRCGLFALLPPPTHSSRKQANRPLIPYTLTKKPAAPKTTPKPSPTSTTTTTTSDPDPLPSQKHQSAFNALTGYESDSEEEEGGRGAVSNFFSIGSKAEGMSSAGLSVVKNAAPAIERVVESSAKTADVKASSGASGDFTTRVPSVSSSRSHLTPSPVRTALESPVSSSSSASSSNVFATASTSRDSSSIAAEKTADGGDGDDDDNNDDDDDDNEVSSTSTGVPVVNQDAPLNFCSSMQHSGPSWMTAPLTSPMIPEMYAAPVNTGAATYWQQQQHYAQDYTEMGEEEQVASSSSGQDIHQYMQDEQFQRISGKRKRGQEDIQIIDANVDDYVDPGELMKGISEESSYQPHRKKDNLPSSQQRRKKQITYLAFQAKERELELKNQWSQNRLTKNQTRSKYGF